jgi:hypothetical protein
MGRKSKVQLLSSGAGAKRSFLNKYPEAGQMMLEVLGYDDVLQLAHLARDEVMIELRVKHRWSLEAIGTLFGISRERVRQLTPRIEGAGETPFGDNGNVSDPEIMRKELKGIFRRAVRDPEAWDGRGQLSKAWVVDQLGYEPDLPELNFRSPSESKMEFILRHGLSLETMEDMRAWAEDMYFKRHMTYKEIAAWISRQFIPVSTMTVHRTFTKVLDVQGFSTGLRPDRQAKGSSSRSSSSQQ